MKLKFEQHLYTSTDPEFETVAKSSGIEGSLQHTLEQNSIYFLPSELLYDDNAQGPTKYIYYRAAENNFVFGRGVYLYKDSLGRPGNYIFHNLVLSASDFALAEFNAAALLQALIATNVFTDQVSTELNSIELSVEIETPQYNQKAKEALPSLISALQENGNVLLRASSEATLNLLALLYHLVPFTARQNTGFDTYSYGSGGVRGFFSLPSGEFFTDNQNRNLTCNLENFSLTTGGTAIEVSPYATTMNQLAQNKSTVYCRRLLYLENIYNLNYSEFLTEIRNTETSDYYTLFGKELKARISGQHDWALFTHFWPYLPNLDTYFADGQLVNALLQSLESDSADDNIEALYSKFEAWVTNQIVSDQGEPLAADQQLLKTYLGRLSLDDAGQLAPLLLKTLELLKKHYEGGLENTIYELLLSRAAEQLFNNDYAAALYKVVKKYDDGEQPPLGFMRELFYCIRKKKITADLLEFDFLQLPETHTSAAIRLVLLVLVDAGKERKMIKHFDNLAEKQSAAFLEKLQSSSQHPAIARAFEAWQQQKTGEN